MGDWTGTVPSHAAGAESKAVKLQTLDDIATALTSAWSTWVPTLTSLTQGNGTVVARYRRLNKTLDWHFKFLLGSTSVVGSDPTFTLPATPASTYATGEMLTICTLLDSGTAFKQGIVDRQAGAVVRPMWLSAGATVSITATVPHTWTTGDFIACQGTVELA